MVAHTLSLGSFDECVDDVQRRDRRVLERDVAVRGPFAPDGSGGDDEVADLDLRLRGAAGAHAQERVDAELAQLLDCDGHRRSAHARRHRGNGDAFDAAREGPVLAAEGDLFRVTQQLGDHRSTPRIAGHEHVAAYISGSKPDVVLLLTGRRHRSKSIRLSPTNSEASP